MKEENRNLVLLIELILLILISTFIGYCFAKINEDTPRHYFSETEIVGLWNKDLKGNKLIQIKTNNLSIESIVNTARHEICHEIYSRQHQFKSNYSSNESEDFAYVCNPKDYYYLK